MQADTPGDLGRKEDDHVNVGEIEQCRHLPAGREADEADAIRMANDSHYGLAAYVWTHDIGRGLRAAHAIESGWVQVNQGGGQTPGMSYGGFKQSGLGREHSMKVLEHYTELKNVFVNIAD